MKKKQTAAPLPPVMLRCESLINPLGLDTPSPRFSWQGRGAVRGAGQRAYQILAAGSPARLGPGTADLWDSGRVESPDMTGIPYGGVPLHSGQDVLWQVRIWDADDEPGPWSEPARFSMGLLRPEDWQAQWLMGPQFGGPPPLFRHEFSLTGPVRRARAYVCGLGYYELRINGCRADDRVLDPAWTEYDKRALYNTYDVTALLSPGANALGVLMGNGWFCLDGKPANPTPQLLLQIVIEYADGSEQTVATGEGCWQATYDGPCRGADIYAGEVWDAGREQPGWDKPGFDARDWLVPLTGAGPGGRLVAQAMEPIRVMQEIKPVACTRPGPGLRVYDLGQNFSGWAKLCTRGERGRRVTLKYAEVLGEDGRVNQQNLRRAANTDVYFFAGNGQETYAPRFTYHGFRYVEVEGLAEDAEAELTGCFIRSAVARTGEFSCADLTVNAIQRAVLWTEGSNLHGLPTDCPQRDERMGWLNDMTVRAEEAVHNYGLDALYTKWMDDINDAQTADGAIPDTAP